MASTKITRTPSSTGSSTTWTYSMWIKLGNIGTEYVLFHNYGSDNTSEVFAKIGASSGVIDFGLRNSSTYNGRLITNRLFRDPSAWYHLVFNCDTTNATAGNRMRIYVNGVEETSFSTDTQPSQNQTTVFNQAYEHTIGSYGSGNYFDGEMAHVHMTDGTVYAASTFGETDSTSGIWKPKTAPSVTYGNIGYFLKFENSGNLDVDSSGNNISFSTSGTLTQNVDTPSNNFATGNPLVMHISHTGTFSNGNNKLVTSAGGKQILVSSLAVSSGKWYAEYKADAVGGGTMIGVIPYEVVVNTLRLNNYLGQDNGSVSMLNTTGAVYNPPTASGITGVTYTSGDIIGVAVDLDNSYCYFHKNGTYINSGNPASGASGTGGVPFTKGDSFWCFAGGDSTDAGGSVATISVNFGSGYFGTTAVSSANADANGHGIMEYAVPSGYYTLNTKNIKEFG